MPVGKGADNASAADFRLRSPEDFGATLFRALGVLPETRLSPDGATEPASAGRPIAEVFG